jgi:hypothetical protein
MALIGIALLLPGIAFPQQQSSGLPTIRFVSTITPIFSQLIKFNFPTNFNPVPDFEKTDGNFYIQERVLPGETVDNWTQMLTVTGSENLAVKNPNLTPKIYALGMTNGFQKACPSSFSGKGIYEGKLSDQDAVIVVAGCGTAPGNIGHSEMAIIAVIKGNKDFYTLQWAQRGAPSPTPIDIDIDMWANRMKSLMPVKLCPIVPGESAPYVSCVGGKGQWRGLGGKGM